MGVWLPTPRPTLKHRFEKSNPQYIKALTNMSERALGYYRKSLKDLSKSKRLVEAVSEPWQEEADARGESGER